MSTGFKSKQCIAFDTHYLNQLMWLKKNNEIVISVAIKMFCSHRNNSSHRLFDRVCSECNSLSNYKDRSTLSYRRNFDYFSILSNLSYYLSIILIARKIFNHIKVYSIWWRVYDICMIYFCSSLESHSVSCACYLIIIGTLYGFSSSYWLIIHEQQL